MNNRAVSDEEIRTHWAETIVKMGKVDAVEDVLHPNRCFACGARNFEIYRVALRHGHECFPYAKTAHPRDLHLLCDDCCASMARALGIQPKLPAFLEVMYSSRVNKRKYWEWFKNRPKQRFDPSFNLVKFKESTTPDASNTTHVLPVAPTRAKIVQEQKEHERVDKGWILGIVVLVLLVLFFNAPNAMNIAAENAGRVLRVIVLGAVLFAAIPLTLVWLFVMLGAALEPLGDIKEIATDRKRHKLGKTVAIIWAILVSLLLVLLVIGGLGGGRSLSKPWL